MFLIPISRSLVLNLQLSSQCHPCSFSSSSASNSAFPSSSSSCFIAHSPSSESLMTGRRHPCHASSGCRYWWPACSDYEWCNSNDDEANSWPHKIYDKLSTFWTAFQCVYFFFIGCCSKLNWWYVVAASPPTRAWTTRCG